MRKLKKTAQVHRGFTLVELLVVIAIIAILAAVVVLIINPLELTRRGRDAARFTDLANLQQAINVAVQEATASSATILCTGTSAPCSGSTNTGARSANGSGWVKVDLSAQNSVSVPTLPVDPTNSTTYHYTYCSDGNGWEIDTNLESAQQTTPPNDKRANDGGNDTALYEVGSNLSLIAASGGCTY
ncbi:MAG: prepilin-type N-terminal cleavage/methylation domain-containing protein [Candidatus Daviesbacteria bacterium]|nr:prepilin-type N-terminal cleavage/methylation domain-containing protein [Candidatus Daviesbacteria bacterium]